MNAENEVPQLLHFAVRVTPRREQLAEQILTHDGHSIYVPLENQWRRLNKRSQTRGWVRAPMVPGYIFLATSEIAMWQSFRAIKEWSFVMSVYGTPRNKDHPDGIPRSIPDWQMEHMRMESAKRTEKPAAVQDWVPNRSSWTRFKDRHHAVTDDPILVEELIRGRKVREFIGRIRGEGMPMIFKVKDVEPV